MNETDYECGHAKWKHEPVCGSPKCECLKFATASSLPSSIRTDERLALLDILEGLSSSAHVTVRARVSEGHTRTRTTTARAIRALLVDPHEREAELARSRRMEKAYATELELTRAKLAEAERKLAAVRAGKLACESAPGHDDPMCRCFHPLSSHAKARGGYDLLHQPYCREPGCGCLNFVK